MNGRYLRKEKCAEIIISLNWGGKKYECHSCFALLYKLKKNNTYSNLRIMKKSTATDPYHSLCPRFFICPFFFLFLFRFSSCSLSCFSCSLSRKLHLLLFYFLYISPSLCFSLLSICRNSVESRQSPNHNHSVSKVWSWRLLVNHRLHINTVSLRSRLFIFSLRLLV